MSLSCCAQVFAATPSKSSNLATKVPAIAEHNLTLEKELHVAEKSLAFTRENFAANDQAVANCMLWVAQLYVQSKQDAKAEPLLLQVLEINEKKNGPQSLELAEASQALAQAYERKGKLQEAGSHYLQALNIREHMNDILMGESLECYGRVLYKLAETSEAAKCFARLRAIRRDNSGYSLERIIRQNNEAVFALKAHKYKESISKLENVVRTDPSYFLARNNLATAYNEFGLSLFDKKFYVHSESCFRKAIDTSRLGRTTEEQLRTSLWNLAVVLRKQRCYSEAVDYITRSINLGSNDPMAYHERGLAFAKLNRHQLAINDFTECIKRNAKIGCAYNHRADCYEKTGQQALVKADRSKAKQLGYDKEIESLRAE